VARITGKREKWGNAWIQLAGSGSYIPILGASAFVWVPLISVYHLDFRQPEGLAWGLSYGLQNHDVVNFLEVLFVFTPCKPCCPIFSPLLLG